jgi:hypothetical protein
MCLVIDVVNAPAKSEATTPGLWVIATAKAPPLSVVCCKGTQTPGLAVNALRFA